MHSKEWSAGAIGKCMRMAAQYGEIGEGVGAGRAAPCDPAWQPRQRVFFGADDCAAYRARLAEGCRAAGVAVCGGCRMPNHVHPILVPSQADGLRGARRGAPALRTGRSPPCWIGAMKQVTINDRPLVAPCHERIQHTRAADPRRIVPQTVAQDVEHRFAGGGPGDRPASKSFDISAPMGHMSRISTGRPGVSASSRRPSCHTPGT